MDGFALFDGYKEEKKYSCVSCGLYKYCTSPKMPPTGGFKKKILIIGSRPAQIDDVHGQQFVGKDGRTLKRILEKHGIDIVEDCASVNAVRCFTKNEISKVNLEACRSKTLQAIEQYKPKIIILVGELAVQSVIAHRWKKNFDNIHKWRGFVIPDQDLMAWVCPVYDPATFDKNEVEATTILENDIANIASYLHKKLPVYKEPKIEYISDLSVLDTIKVGEVAFDYETTGLKPHAKGHRIVCASVADTPDHVYTFLMPGSRKKRKPFTDLLQRREVYKMAHNMKFEDNWTNVRLGIGVNGWMFDSQIAAHQIDNRKGVTGLKFQTYVRLGVVDYDSEISPILKSVDDTSNGFNRIIEFMNKSKENEDKVLKYCAYDSINEYRIAIMQKREMNYDFLPF